MSNINDFELQDGVLIHYNGSDAEVVIPDGITSIGKDAFRDDKRLTNLTIPDSVTSIGDRAFYMCSSLKSITIPDSMENIGYCAFRECGCLENIYVSDLKSFLNIEYNYPPFWEDVNLYINGESAKEITVPHGIDTIKDYAFYGCSNLKSIKIMDEVISIGHRAFAGCGNLTNIVIPNSVAKIESYAFENCRSLETIAIPVNIDCINAGTFRGCSSLKSVLIPERVTSIEDSAFKDCSSLMSISFPDQLTRIGKTAFEGCSSLSDVTIPSNLTRLPNAFDDTVVILDRYIKDIDKENISSRLVFKTTPIQEIKSTNAKRIAVKGFLTVKDLSVYSDDVIESYKKFLKGKIVNYRDVVLENNTEMIVRRLASLNLLDSKLINKMMEQDLSDEVKNILSEHNDENTKGGKDSVSKKKGPSVTELKKIWGYKKTEEGITITSYKDVDTDVVVPEKIGKEIVTEIGDHAFSTSKSGLNEKQKEVRRKIKTVTMPNTINNIGASAFSGCNSLLNITIPNGVTSIRERTFSDCNQLEAIVIPVGINNIDWMAFGQCGSLKDIKIPDGVTSIGNNAFVGCGSLTEITIPSSVTNLGVGVFANCRNLKDVKYLGDLNSYLRIAFKDTAWPKVDLHINGELVTEVSIPDGMTSIGAYAFANCGSLKSVTISNCASIGYMAFAGCNKLENVMISDSVTSIGWNAFYGCNSLTKVTIPSSLTSIEDGIFQECNNLTSIAIPDSVVSIGRSAFYGCSSLTSITIPDSVTSIGWSAFEGCSDLTIHAHSGSHAEEYAKENNIPFKPLDQ